MVNPVRFNETAVDAGRHLGETRLVRPSDRLTAAGGRSNPQRKGPPLPTAANGQLTRCVRRQLSR